MVDFMSELETASLLEFWFNYALVYFAAFLGGLLIA